MRYRSVIWTGLAWFALDWITKQWAAISLPSRITFVGDWFYLALHRNRGIAFGIPLSPLLQITISLLLIGCLVYWLLVTKKKSFLIQTVFGIILGGAMGNLVDRFSHRYVVDFIVLKPFPVFNFADIGITLGLVTLAYLITRKPQ